MLRFQAGDDAAFDRLVEVTKRDIFSLGYRYGLTRQDADDLAQEVFLRVYKARGKYRPEARFRAWLLRIATNYVISQARKKKLRYAVSLQALKVDAEGAEIEIEDERAQAPWERMQAEERQSMLEQAMARIPEQQRIALELNRFQDLSYEDVAEALGLKIPAVKSLLYRARQSLKQALEPLMGGD
ncbi:MAG: RNA polymerase sigma factor [Planctomycetota bacterium]|jgi:RNA polymerase sigma-70 factor (ECF subfamily)